MKRLTLLTTACAVAVLALLATQLRAQDTNTLDRTFLKFSTAVELPGVTLEPGEYEFRLADNQRQNVVQVIRRSDMKPMGQFTFAEANRDRTSDETVVMFREAREGSTPAIQYWYFPTEKIGKEFIYPKDQAERIAARTGQAVRSEDGPVTAPAAASAPAAPAAPAPAPASAQASASEASEADAARRNAPVAAQPTAPAGSTAGNRGVAESGAVAAATAAESTAAASSAGADAARASIDRDATANRPVGTSGIAQQSDADAAQARNEGQIARNELPRTASPLPLSALLGLLSLAGAAGIRMMRA